MKARRACFIAFEGGEGAGKTTQIGLLAESLRASGQDPLVTREPGGTATGAEIRRLLVARDRSPLTAEAETLLLVADRAQHIAEVIEPALASGRLVITDRFVLSTLAYQAAGRGVAESLIRGLHAATCRGLWPDLTIVLDLDARLGLARSRRRLASQSSDESFFESLDLAFHERVRAGFRQHSAALKGVLTIDATEPPERLAATIRDAVARLPGAGL